MKNQFIHQLSKPLFILAVLIIICSFLAHLLSDSETLAEYAANNPEAAYGADRTDKTGTQGNGLTNKTGSQSTDHADGSLQDTALGTDTAYQSAEPHIDEAEKKITPEKESDIMDTTNKTGVSAFPYSSDATQQVSPDRIVYREGFYYESLTNKVKERITGISYPVSAAEASAFAAPVSNILADGEEAAISYEDLRYLSILYYDFDNEIQRGELICNRGIAEDLVEIFYELYLNEYQLERVALIEEYNGDDTASMEANNTSCFNYRVIDDTTTLSKHALGCAIDINPFYNPYIIFNKKGSGEDYISPAGSEIYADRAKDFPYKIDESDLCYKLFTEHGFTWGGNWNSSKDYQHFQKVLE